ncbi:MAG: sulfatase-like hydrolase/transferase [Alphaproteobacteria bacterium GM202ARS2]|nr:sulfatase-like hydrolase/transferase [Alphaproteobacteria bacterium GM202ARS2]
MTKNDWHNVRDSVLACFNVSATHIKNKRWLRVALVAVSTAVIFVALPVLPVLPDESRNIAPIMLFSLPIFMLALTYFNARNRPTLMSLILIALSLIAFIYLRNILYWIQRIGTDSLSEIALFKWEEAVFFIGTLSSLISVDKVITIKPIQVFLTWFIVGGLAFYLFTRYRQVYVYAVRHVVFSLALLWISYTVYSIHSLFIDNIKIRTIVTENLQVDDVTISREDYRPRRVIVYIGESTSALHMSLYGYPRETTPQLAKLASQEGFILFHHTLSLHTHTTPSLVEALTIDLAPTSHPRKVQTFHRSRKRLSIIDALNRGDVETIWISSQERSGTWNLASSVIGVAASQKKWAVDKKTTILSNLALKIERPDDLTFFVQEIDKLDTKDTTALFLQSYAGHGSERERGQEEPWQDLMGKQDLISSMSGAALYGSATEEGLQKRHSQYDNAIKYIDNSVTTIISNYASSKEEPVIFIYFSDHGESIFEGHGHDSARFVFEMATVPFFIYFNTAARQQFADKYKHLRDIAYAKQPITLDSVASILTFLFDMTIESDNFSMGPNLAPITLPPAITVRNTASGPTAIFLGSKAFSDKYPSTRRVNDSATDLYGAKHITLKNKHDNGEICTHAANHLGRALKGLLASNCIEIDIVVQDDGAIHVYHPPQDHIGLELEAIWQSVAHHDGALWLDAKNIKQPAACEHLRAFLAARVQDEHKPRSVLVEFPPPTNFDDPAIRACAQQITGLVTYVSYYVPTQLGLACRESLQDRAVQAPVETSASCLSLREKIDTALGTGFISDISFDYRLLPAIEALGYDHTVVRFHTWHVQAARIDTIPYEKFGFIVAR